MYKACCVVAGMGLALAVLPFALMLYSGISWALTGAYPTQGIGIFRAVTGTVSAVVLGVGVAYVFAFFSCAFQPDQENKKND